MASKASQLVEETPVPEIGDHQILVKIHAASLNYRDIVIARVCDAMQSSTSLPCL